MTTLEIPDQGVLLVFLQTDGDLSFIILSWGLPIHLLCTFLFSPDLLTFHPLLQVFYLALQIIIIFLDTI